MELIIKDGGTLLMRAIGSDHFTFDTGETEDDTLLINATEILILTPKAPSDGDSFVTIGPGNCSLLIVKNESGSC